MFRWVSWTHPVTQWKTIFQFFIRIRDNSKPVFNIHLNKNCFISLLFGEMEKQVSMPFFVLITEYSFIFLTSGFCIYYCIWNFCGPEEGKPFSPSTIDERTPINESVASSVSSLYLVIPAKSLKHASPRKAAVEKNQLVVRAAD